MREIPGPDDWPDREWDLFENLIGDEPEILDDPRLQMDFHGALFDREIAPELRERLHDDLIDHLWNEYGIDFELDFDWEAYREWYDNAA